MASIEEHVEGRTPTSAEEIHTLRELVADWQLLSDLSFADLVLWVPLGKDDTSWPTGYIAVAHIRPTTAATVFANRRSRSRAGVGDQQLPLLSLPMI